jgi:hypothetical protein
MQDLFDAAKLEERRNRIRYPVGEFCNDVGINASSWERLRAGREPRLSTAWRIEKAIERREIDLLAHLIELHPEKAAELLAAAKRGEAA